MSKVFILYSIELFSFLETMILVQRKPVSVLHLRRSSMRCFLRRFHMNFTKIRFFFCFSVESLLHTAYRVVSSLKSKLFDTKRAGIPDQCHVGFALEAISRNVSDILYYQFMSEIISGH
jgi:hypothetical protein